jgi:alpha-D-ribose 1-methylphosphonate 5-triphosphate synthase subunit PhnG
MSTPLPDRAEALGLLARARPGRLAELAPDLPSHSLLRGPETGAVMVQGRQGGTGAPFNLGELTATRCSVRLDCGAVGHSWVQGRDKAHARRAAVLDALMQTERAAALAATVLVQLANDETARREEQSRKAGATRVEFFTMVRGEDA